MIGRRTAGATAALAVLFTGLLDTSVGAQSAPAAPVPSIRVEGQASRAVAPDLAVVGIGIVTNRPKAADAAADNSKAAAAMLATVKAAGIADSDVGTAQASLDPVYETRRDGSQGTAVTGYRAENRVEVKIRKLAAVGEIIGKLIDGGANNLEGIDFAVADPKPITDTLRREAALDARHKAEIAAEALGVRLGRVLEIAPDASATAVTAPRFKTMAVLAPAPAGATPLQAGQQIFEARASVTWELLQ